jgi:hypothetical protein
MEEPSLSVEARFSQATRNCLQRLRNNSTQGTLPSNVSRFPVFPKREVVLFCEQILLSIPLKKFLCQWYWSRRCRGSSPCRVRFFFVSMLATQFPIQWVSEPSFLCCKVVRSVTSRWWGFFILSTQRHYRRLILLLIVLYVSVLRPSSSRNILLARITQVTTDLF